MLKILIYITALLFILLSQEKKVSFTLFKKEDSTWGYTISVNEKPKIYQNSIPGKGGNKGFKYKEDALNVAMLIVEKMKKNIFPPTINHKELDSLKLKEFSNLP